MTGNSKEVASRIQCCDSGFWEKKHLFKIDYIRNDSVWFTQPLREPSDFESALIAMLRYGTYTMKGL